MARLSDQAGEVVYPRMTRKQIEIAMTGLMLVHASTRDAADQAASDELLAYLLSFYTKRWGLPAWLAARRDEQPDAAPPRSAGVFEQPERPHHIQ